MPCSWFNFRIFIQVPNQIFLEFFVPEFQVVGESNRSTYEGPLYAQSSTSAFIGVGLVCVPDQSSCIIWCKPIVLVLFTFVRQLDRQRPVLGLAKSSFTSTM